MKKIWFAVSVVTVMMMILSACQFGGKAEKTVGMSSLFPDNNPKMGIEFRVASCKNNSLEVSVDGKKYTVVPSDKRVKNYDQSYRIVEEGDKAIFGSYDADKGLEMTDAMPLFDCSIWETRKNNVYLAFANSYNNMGNRLTVLYEKNSFPKIDDGSLWANKMGSYHAWQYPGDGYPLIVENLDTHTVTIAHGGLYYVDNLKYSILRPGETYQGYMNFISTGQMMVTKRAPIISKESQKKLEEMVKNTDLADRNLDYVGVCGFISNIPEMFSGITVQDAQKLCDNLVFAEYFPTD